MRIASALLLVALGAAPAHATDFHLPAYETWALPNGMKVHTLPDSKLPFVYLEVTIGSGSAQDPPGKDGLAWVTQNLLNRGAGRRDALAIARDIESVGGMLGGDTVVDRSTVSLEVLREDLPLATEILADLVRRPAFPETEFEKTRSLLVTSLRQQDEDANAIAAREIAPFLLGSHPYAHPVTGRPESLGALKVRDVKAFHAEHYRPANAMCVVAGDFDPAALRTLLEKSFGDWKGANDPPAPPPASPSVAGGRVLLVNKPDATEAAIRVGGVAFGVGSPDEPAAAVLNTALGGSFSSRLVSTIRVERGLTYYIYSRFLAQRGTGIFTIATSTRLDALAETLERIRSILAEVAASGLRDAEVTTARSFVAGQWPLAMETNQGLASLVRTIERNGLGRDWADGFTARIRAVDAEAARAVAARYLDPARMVWVVVGPAGTIRPTVEKYGTVTVRPVSSPAARKENGDLRP